MADQQFRHLSDAAACLQSAGGLFQLQSHLRWTCSKLANHHVNNSSAMCHQCGQSWSTGKFSLKLKSFSSPGPQMLKIVKNGEKGGKLSRVESSLLKRYTQNKGKNRMVLTCIACKNETPTQFKKPVKKKSRGTETPVVANVSTTTKKKKKKDRFAGLNASAVIAATPSPSCSSQASPNLQRLVNAQIPATKSTLKDSPHGTQNIVHSVTPTLKQSISNVNKKGPLGQKLKMRLLQCEIKQAEKTRRTEEMKALRMRNENIKKNSKLQDFMRKADKEVSLDDRLNCLLQI